jgi:hypothetical protein
MLESELIATVQVPWVGSVWSRSQPLVSVRGCDLLHRHSLLDLLLPPPDQGAHQGIHIFLFRNVVFL